MTIIKNSFHNTETTVHASIGDTLSTYQVRRARKALCGISECQCCGVAGQRGHQDGFTIEDNGDGTALLCRK